jgi:hypothetical protein
LWKNALSSNDLNWDDDDVIKEALMTVMSFHERQQLIENYCSKQE